MIAPRLCGPQEEVETPGVPRQDSEAGSTVVMRSQSQERQHEEHEWRPAGLHVFH